VILRCNFEELGALTAGMQSVLSAGGGGGVAAPSEVVMEVEALLPRLVGDVSVSTYEEQQGIERALLFVVEHLKDRMDDRVLSEYPAAESAVQAYFNYARVLTVFNRVCDMGLEMAAMIELMTGRMPTAQSSRSISFPD
jgi:hypothetical protein